MKTTTGQTKLARLTANIVIAYVENHSVEVSDVATVIRTVAGELQGAGQTPAAPAEKPSPAVPIRRSVQPDAITCLICGRKQKVLKRHLGKAHELTPGEYRAMFELKPDYPMAAPAYSEARSALAVKLGLGRKPAPAAKKPARRRRKAAETA